MLLHRAFFRPSFSWRSGRSTRTSRAARPVRTLRRVQARAGVVRYSRRRRGLRGRRMTTTSEDRDPERTWRRLRENPDYVADWRASAGPTAREAPPLAFRRQTEADLEAARWELLA